MSSAGNTCSKGYILFIEALLLLIMTQPNLLELAKQGNANAIATLINRQLQPKGISAKAEVKNGCLQIMLESAQVPKEQAMVAFVRKGMMGLGTSSIKKVRVYGRQIGEDFPAWTQEFLLGTKLPSPAPLSTRVPPPVSNSDDPNVDLASLISGDDSDFDVSKLVNELYPSPPSTPVVTTPASQPQTETWRCIHTFTGHSSWVRTVAFNLDGQTLASGSLSDGIKIWQIKTSTEVRTIREHESWVHSIAFSPDGKILASDSGGLQTIKILNWQTGQELRTLGALSLGHSNLAKTVAIFSTFVAGHSNEIQSIAFSPDGKILASGSADKTIKIWDVKKGKEIRTLTGHSAGVESVAFDPDGKILASGSHDKTTKVWDWRTGEELCTLRGHGDSVQAVAFSPDGQTLATCSRDSTIGIWDVSTGREIRTLTGHSDVVFSVAFNLDGKTLASGSGDKTIKLWDVRMGKELCTLNGHSKSVYSVAFSPDGQTLASGSEDTTIMLWCTFY
jgi:WD40 repeat protein